VWTVLVFVIYTVAGVAGREHFSEILSNFLAILGYWIAFFVAILLEEHYLFRRAGGPLGGYDFTAYDDARRLPVGIAGVLACCFGVAGAVVGMAEVWYTGPLGKMIGPFGGDMVCRLCFTLTSEGNSDPAHRASSSRSRSRRSRTRRCAGSRSAGSAGETVPSRWMNIPGGVL
jgi:purine-cytosine permease-like protein